MGARQVGEGRTLVVVVKPRSAKGPLVQPQEDGTFMVYVREPPIEGQATRAAAAALAEHMEVPKSHIQLVSGATSRYKRFRVE